MSRVNPISISFGFPQQVSGEHFNSLAVGIGHVAECQDRVLIGVELENREADCRERPNKGPFQKLNIGSSAQLESQKHHFLYETEPSSLTLVCQISEKFHHKLTVIGLVLAWKTTRDNRCLL